jgi:hypothetical protein
MKISNLRDKLCWDKEPIVRHAVFAMLSDEIKHGKIPFRNAAWDQILVGLRDIIFHCKQINEN